MCESLTYSVGVMEGQQVRKTISLKLREQPMPKVEAPAVVKEDEKELGKICPISCCTIELLISYGVHRDRVAIHEWCLIEYTVIEWCLIEYTVIEWCLIEYTVIEWCLIEYTVNIQL